MEIQCVQENFIKGVTTAARIATTRSSLPILANIYLKTEDGRLKISATDLEIGITNWIGVKIKNEGSITLPAKLLADFITNNTDPTVFIKVDNNEANVISKRYNAKIKGMDPNDFPLIPEPKKDFCFTVSMGVLKNGLQKVIFAVAVGDTRPVLNGVSFKIEKDSLILAATDSYRLAEKIIKIKNSNKKDIAVVVPIRLATELIRILADDEEEISVAIGQNQISFETDSLQMISRLIEGSFPEYKQIIPQEETTTIFIEKAELVHSIKVVDFFVRDTSHGIKFIIDSKKNSKQLLIKAVSSTLGENIASVSADIEGKSLEISFNAKYMVDCLNVINTEQIHLKLFGTDRPMIINPVGDPTYFNLVMPLKTND